MDTIMIIRDSVAMCVNKMAATCQPCVKVVETNWQDILIVVTICMAIAIIAISICNRYFKWKDDERNALIKADEEKRKNEEKDREWKQKVDLMNKLLDLQKNHAEIKRDEHGNQIKRHDDSAYAKYEQTLRTLVDDVKLRTNGDNK